MTQFYRSKQLVKQLNNAAVSGDILKLKVSDSNFLNISEDELRAIALLLLENDLKKG